MRENAGPLAGVFLLPLPLVKLVMLVCINVQVPS
jgi:hypothetical protein